MITLGKAILAIQPLADFSYDNNDYATLIWHSLNITKPTESEIQAKIQELQAAEPMRLLRLERDSLITSTDWWVLPDRTPTQAQLDYRQALRDLPANSPNAAIDENGQLINVTWPVKPE